MHVLCADDNVSNDLCKWNKTQGTIAHLTFAFNCAYALLFPIINTAI